MPSIKFGFNGSLKINKKEKDLTEFIIFNSEAIIGDLSLSQNSLFTGGSGKPY